MSICYISTSLLNVNDLSDPYHVAAYARDYDEIVVEFPLNTNNQDVSRILNIVQLINKPVWFIPYHKIADIAGMTPNQHRLAAKALIQAQIKAIVTLYTSFSPSTVKGIAFDFLNYESRWGDLTLLEDDDAPSPSEPWHLDRVFTNDCIGFARQHAKPVMLIVNNVHEHLSTMYPGLETDSPGAASWPVVIGTDSSKVDWIVVRDPILAPPVLFSDSPNKLPLTFALSRLGMVSQAKQFRTSNLLVGALQEYSFYPIRSDSVLGVFLTDLDSARLRNIATVMDLLAIDGWGFKAISARYPIVVNHSLLESLPVGTGTAMVQYPIITGTPVEVWSLNGVLTLQYVDEDDEVKTYRFDQDLSPLF